MANENIKGPKISQAQIIGQMAEAAIYAQKPHLWSLTPKGGSDFGYDFEVLIFANQSEGGQFYINIQLKGTTQIDSLSSDKSFISHSFNKRTLELWNVSGATCVLLIVDFSETDEPSIAPIYFHLVNEDLEKILPTIPSTQEYVTLRIPTATKLHKHIDIIPLVRPYLSELKEARAEIRRIKASANPSDLTVLSTSSHGGEIFQLFDVDNSDIKSLIENATDSELYKIQLNNLRIGDFQSVINAISPPSLNEIASNPTDAGLKAYILSKALEETADKDQAIVMMRLAAQLLGTNDEVLAGYFQIQFEALKLGKEGEPERLALLEELNPHKGAYITAMKSRLMAMSGRFDEARSCLEGYPQEKIALTVPTISIIEHDWSKAISEIDELSKLTILQPKAKFWLILLKARAYFELALKEIPRGEDSELYVPSVGLPGIDMPVLQQAYDCSFKAMKEAQKLNWPVSTDYVLDVFAISSMIFGRMDSSLPLLSEFLFAKPHLTKAREFVSRLSIQFQHPKIALKLAEVAIGLPKFENQDLMIVAAIIAAGNPGEAFKQLTDEIYLHSVKNEFYYSSLLIVGLAADNAFQSKILEKIREELGSSSLGKENLALLDCAIKVHHSQLNKFDAIIELKDYWLGNGRPYRLGLHILDNLNPLDKKEATEAAAVAELYLEDNCLPSDQVLQYAHSLLTIGQHQKAIGVLEAATIRFPDIYHIQSLLGIAYEINGQSERAFTIIQALLQNGNATNNARQYFCNIAIRMGYFEVAIHQMQSALATTPSKSAQLSIIETLVKLLLAVGNRQEEVERLAWQYGTLADQNNEKQEGQFLLLYLMATSSSEIALAESRLQSFRLRMDAYSEKFPNSDVIWRTDLPENSTPEVQQEAFYKAVGETAESLKRGETLERKLNEGTVMVPFSWRPRRFLKNVSDVFSLWELSKQIGEELNGYHLLLYTTDDPIETPAISLQNELVISLISLIVLNELGLLELILNTFPKVIIARNVLMRLQAARSFNASFVETKVANQILEKLQQNFGKIISPPIEPIDEEEHFISWHLEEKQAMDAPGRVYLCDDIFESALVCPVQNKTFSKMRITTLDFLHWADENLSILTAEQVADSIGKMCDLNLGLVSVRPRYLMAAIPKSLQEASNEKEEHIAFEKAHTLNSILDGLWTFNKSYEEISAHFTSNITYLMNKGNANLPVITSLWVRWVEAIRFKTDIHLQLIERIGLEFVQILIFLPDDKQLIRKLWIALATVLRRCCSGELNQAEDVQGILLIAQALGRVRAKQIEVEGLDVGHLFTRAHLGFEENTQLYELFSKSYVEAVAKSAIIDSKTHST